MTKKEWFKSHQKSSCQLQYSSLLAKKATLGRTDVDQKKCRTLYGCPEESREKAAKEHKLSLSLNSSVEPAVEKPRRAPKRKLESSAPKRIERPRQDCPSEEGDESPVRRPREDSVSSSSQNR